jgi:hypothetical protein
MPAEGNSQKEDQEQPESDSGWNFIQNIWPEIRNRGSLVVKAFLHEK